jgi:hypothetical protein
MCARWLLVVFVPLGLLALGVIGSQAQDPASTTANPEAIEAALKLTVAAAAEYEIRIGENDKPLELQREPVLKWSNPDRGEVHGNVFLWTRDGRPLMVASLYKWFTPHTHMAHEFQSLAEQPFGVKFHGQPVWQTSESGLRFVDLPGAAAPAAKEANRLLQLKQLAKDFSGSKQERDDTKLVQLRLLPQPIYRYAAPKQGILCGGLFTLVHGTDPEIFLLIEARGESAERVRWQYAVTRMTSAEVRLRHADREVWVAETLPWREVGNHKHAYTTFMFKEIPDFLKGALDKPKP